MPGMDQLRKYNGYVRQCALGNMSVHVTLNVPETVYDICQDIQNANIDFLLTAFHILLRIINNLAKLILKREETKTKFYLAVGVPGLLVSSNNVILRSTSWQ